LRRAFQKTDHVRRISAWSNTAEILIYVPCPDSSAHERWESLADRRVRIKDRIKTIDADASAS
jgi:hypothetical protein